MRLPNYEDCSLQELYDFLAERHLPVRFTRAQAHTKTLYKRDKEERRKLTAVLDKADAATTIRFMEFPPELRDQIYEYILEDITTADPLTKAEFRERMCRVSTQFWMEARDVFNRGVYDTIPELAAPSAGPLTPAPETGRVVAAQDDGSGGFLTPIAQTPSVVPHGMSSNNIGPNVTRFRFSLMGSAGQGKSLLMSSSQPVHDFTMTPRGGRLSQFAVRHREILYEAYR